MFTYNTHTKSKDARSGTMVTENEKNIKFIII